LKIGSGAFTPDNQGDERIRIGLARVTSRSTPEQLPQLDNLVHLQSNPNMAPNPLANWEKIGDSFYRKIAVYDAIFEDDIELENYIVAGAPYGGAIGEPGPVDTFEIWS
jgi:hypothetical protein